MNRAIDRRNLQILVTLAKKRNMSKAARELGLMTSAISQIIRQIEDSFGVVPYNWGEDRYRLQRPASRCETEQHCL